MNIELIEPDATDGPQDIADIRDGSAVVKLNRTEAGLAQLRADLAGKAYDLTTTKGDKAARSDRLRCVSLRANVEKLRKALKTPALELPIDAAIQADVARREEERQAKARAEAARLAGLREAVAVALGKWVGRCQAADITADRIAAGIEMLVELVPLEAWSEVGEFWQSAKAQALATMRRLHSEAQQREDDARLKAKREEYERQAKALRDEAAALAEAQRKAAEDARVAALAKQREQEAAAALAPVPEPKPVTLTTDKQSLSVAPLAKCDGNHAGPKCADPECWNGDAPNSEPAINEPATLTLGAICARLGFNISGAFLADTLHVRPAATDKRAQLYTESQYQVICRQLLAHIGEVADLYAGQIA